MTENPKYQNYVLQTVPTALEILQAIVLICFIYFGKPFHSSQFSLLISFILFRFVNGWRVKELTNGRYYYLLFTPFHLLQ
jgi:ABC-type transport system involved in Fe-S cluster assembly fused permease/ATPase subunit